MRSRMLLGAGNYLLPVLFLFSLFLLFRGHHSPGGGFTGGLTAASGIAFYIITHGKRSVKDVLPISSSAIIILGTVILLLTGILGFFTGGNFLQSIPASWEVATLGRPSTALLFEAGIFLVVVGSVTKIILTLTNE